MGSLLVCFISSAAFSPQNERGDKDQDRVNGGDRVFRLEPRGLTAECNLLARRRGMRHLRLRVPVEQVFTVRHGRRVDRVRDGRPQRAADEEERQRWPEGVREKGGECIAECVGCNERAERGLSLTTEPRREDERADDAKRDGKLAQSVRDDRCETRPDQPSELLVGGVCNKRFLHDQDNRDGEHRNGKENRVQTQRGVQEAGEPLCAGHLFHVLAPETEVELEGSIDGSNGPSGALLEMAAVVLGNSTELKRLVDKSCLPPLTKHERGCSDILSQGSKREVTDLIEGLSSSYVAGTGAPGDTEGILNGLDDVHEEVETLG
ncbi:hypothetical protein HG530_011091 [Fusarium avenaceum]|nr:hypothetical protein HG530_011091 [Fusarium avenaceum]